MIALIKGVVHAAGAVVRIEEQWNAECRNRDSQARIAISAPPDASLKFPSAASSDDGYGWATPCHRAGISIQSTWGTPVKPTLILVSALLVLGTMGIAHAGDAHKKGGNDAAGAATHVAPPTDQSAVTHGSVSVDGKTINYTATTGVLILKNKDDKPVASMSYVAYVKSGVKDPATRPITFLYNGGPGSSTIWLHMLAFGP
ncbi:MAG TPA: hypothetical protein VFX04_07005, partial [Rhodanobacteraceae bacterium]|nr:hypothetical protein [Rhodanobacteraceae bacterium]